MTCHVIAEDMLISQTDPIQDEIRRPVSDEYGIGHSNLQFEYDAEIGGIPRPGDLWYPWTGKFRKGGA